MLKQTWSLVAVLFAILVTAAPAHAQKRDVVITMKWDGSVADEKLMKSAPEAITSTKQFEKIWKAWKIEGDTPRIDFDKFLVVGVYSRGSRLNIASVKLDEKGNLEVVGLGTRDFRDGFRYVLGVVSNDGVKTVNGKQLAKRAE